MTSISRLTDKKFWEQSGNDIPATCANSWFQEYFDSYIPQGLGKKALEIGVCPGNNLAAISKSHNYTPYGIDILDSVAYLPDNFRKLGIENMQAVNEDIFKWIPKEGFDVVMSFGFIEHFIEWEKAIDKHWELLNAGGYLVLGVPTMGLFQLALRRLTYTPEKLIEVLESHNLDAMNLSNIKGHIKRITGAQIVFAEYIHNMDTWITPGSSFIRPSRRWIVKAWHKMAKFPRKLRLSSSSYSPYALIIVKKQIYR